MAENKAFDSIMKGLSESLDFAKGDASKARQMSKLKADVTIPVYGTIADAEVYLKSDVDKVIKELKDSVNYNFEQFYNERKLLLYNKYKRCLDKAKICQLCIERYERYIAEFKDCGHPTIKKWRFLKNHYEKWFERWLKLAEKFKPNKDVVWN